MMSELKAGHIQDLVQSMLTATLIDHWTCTSEALCGRKLGS